MHKILEMIVQDGGAKLGFKKAMTNQIVECGSQLYNKLSVPAELVVFDEHTYKQREARVQEATDKLVREIEKILDKGQHVAMDCVTSWDPAYAKDKTKFQRPSV